MSSIDTIDALQNETIKQLDNTKKKENKYKFDKLKMFFCKDYKINDIIIRQPRIGEILEVGESDFYNSISPFIYNSTSIRLFLWENEIDWNKTKDIEVFNFLIKTVDKDILKYMFPNLIFDFQLMKTSNNDFALFSPSQKILLNEEEFMMIAEYIRELFNSHPKVEKAKGKTTKKWMIQEEKMKAAENESKDKESVLLPLVSACMNHPGFNYSLAELENIGIYQFMDSVKRLQIYENTKALLNGSFCGMADLSKVNKEEFNFMRDI